MTDETMQNLENGERGAALIMALLTLALLLALTLGMTLTSISELGVSSTYGNQTIALDAAEAGLNHAASLVSNYNGTSFTALLLLRPAAPVGTIYMNWTHPFGPENAASFPGCVMMDPDSATRGFQLRDGVTGAVVPDVYYRVSLIDDEPTAAPVVPNFNPVGYSETTVPNENNPNLDKNNRLVIYSTGTYANASVTLEGWVGFLPFPALSANGNVEISGNAQITGAYGGVHSNSGMVENGNGWWVEQTVTATGTLTGDYTGQVGGFCGGNQPPLDLPPFVTRDPIISGDPYTAPRLQDFLIRRADTLLIDPAFANGAHSLDKNDTASPATRQLRRIADRLNIDYALLAAQLDENLVQGNVQQTNPVAISVSRTVSGDFNSLGIPVKLADTTDVGWSYSSNSWGIVPNALPAVAGGHTVYAIGTNNYDTSNQNLASAGSSTKNGGDILLNGNVGQGGPPLAVTMFSTGSIEVRGNVNITANLLDVSTSFLPPFVTPNVLMMAVEDIWVNGDFAANIAFTGVSYAGEAVKLSGSGSINGQMIAFNWPHVSGSPVDALNVVTGNFQLTLNNGDSIGRVKLYSWRQIKR